MTPRSLVQRQDPVIALAKSKVSAPTMDRRRIEQDREVAGGSWIQGDWRRRHRVCSTQYSQIDVSTDGTFQSAGAL